MTDRRGERTVCTQHRASGLIADATGGEREI
jgi:hypothetical protein